MSGAGLRLLLFKECLRNNIVPFIIKDDIKMFYYRGLKALGFVFARPLRFVHIDVVNQLVQICYRC